MGLFVAALALPGACHAKTDAIEAVSRFASRAEVSTQAGSLHLLKSPGNNRHIESEYTYSFIGEPHGTGYYVYRGNAKMTSTKIRQAISTTRNAGGKLRIPVDKGILKAIIPGFAERHIPKFDIYEYGQVNPLSYISSDTWTRSIGTQWNLLHNRTVEFTYSDSKLRGNLFCFAANPDCELILRSDSYQVEIYPDNPDRMDWSILLAQHNSEKFPDNVYTVQINGEYDVYNGITVGLSLGANLNGMTPTGGAYSEIASPLVFEYVNGSDTRFQEFYQKDIGYYKLTLGYELKF